MQTWQTIDKSEWPDGKWKTEPDKAQWIDEATGLDCLIVRGPLGSLCGYVGVAPGHPYHGKSYGDDGCELSAHGGITFSDGCADASRETWEEWRAMMLNRKAEAEKYPQGDAAEALLDHAKELEDYDAWVASNVASSICHIPGAGRPDNVWWFGFDCAHSGDYSPKHDAIMSKIMPHRPFRDGTEKYRDFAYVKREVEDLATQLFAVQEEAAK